MNQQVSTEEIIKKLTMLANSFSKWEKAEADKCACEDLISQKRNLYAEHETIPERYLNPPKADGKDSKWPLKTIGIAIPVAIVITILYYMFVGSAIGFWLLAYIIGYLLVLFIGPPLRKKSILAKQNLYIENCKKAVAEIEERNKSIDIQNKNLSVELDELNNHLSGLHNVLYDAKEEAKEIASTCTSWFPMDYCYPMAVNSFLKSFQNHRVNTIAEAINIYEDDLHKSAMREEAQKQTAYANASLVESQRHNFESEVNQRLQRSATERAAEASESAARESARAADEAEKIRKHFEK